jgi:hypothetical protein
MLRPSTHILKRQGGFRQPIAISYGCPTGLPLLRIALRLLFDALVALSGEYQPWPHP